MKTQKISTMATVVLMAIALGACKKNDGTPASTAPQMAFQLKAVNSSAGLASVNGLVTQSTASASVTWTSGTANITRFKLEAKKNGTEIELTSRNLSNVDLFSISPSVTSITLNPGTFTEIEIKIMFTHSADPASMPLILKGTYNSGTGDIPIEFDLNDDATIKAEAENVTVAAGMDYTSIIQMHLDKLLKGISTADLDGAAQTGGTIVISQASNTALYDAIRLNLGTSCDNQFEEHHHGEGNDDNGNHGNDDGSNHN